MPTTTPTRAACLVSDVALRQATTAEILRVYAADYRHITATVDGHAVALIAFRRIDGRMWGLYHPFLPPPVHVHRSVWRQVLHLFRRELRAQTEVVHVLAQEEHSSRLFRLLGLQPAGYSAYGKDVWKWTPARCS